MSGEIKTGGSGSTTAEKNSKKIACSLGRYTGIFYSVLAGFWTVLMATMSKILIRFTAIEITFYAQLYSLTLLLPGIIWTRPIMPKVTLRNVVLWISSGALLIAGITLKTTAFQLLPLGEASSIIFSTPIVTSVFSWIILKDRLTWMTVLSLILSGVGMLLTMRVPEMIAFPELYDHLDSDQHLIGCAYAIGCVICTSGIMIVLRILKDVPPMINTVIQSTFVIIVCACTIPAFGGFHHPECDLITGSGLIGLGAFALLGTVFFNMALQLEDPTTMGTVYRSTDIIFAFLIQVIFFRDPVDVYAISGALVVFMSGLLMPLQKWMEGKPEGCFWRESCLLK